LVASVEISGYADGNRGTVGKRAFLRRRVDRHAHQPVTHPVTGEGRGTRGVHDLLVGAEAQQVVAQRPFEVEACGLALVVPAADATGARGTSFADRRRAENLVVRTVAIQNAAVGIPLAERAGTALVDTVH